MRPGTSSCVSTALHARQAHAPRRCRSTRSARTDAGCARSRPTACRRPAGRTSRRSRRAPWARRPGAARCRRRSRRTARRVSRGFMRRPAARLHRVDDLGVAGAAADVAGERLADLGLARAAALRRSRSCVATTRPGRAEAALHGARLDECLLHRVQPLAGAEALDRHDLAAVRPGRRAPGTRRPARRRGTPSTSRTRPARTRSSSPAGRAGRAARRAGSRPPTRRRPRARGR